MIDKFNTDTLRGRAFYFGSAIGVLTWIISSPILGKFFDYYDTLHIYHLKGYALGAFFGQMIGAIGLGFVCDTILFNRIHYLHIVLLSLLSFFVIWFSEMTVLVTDIISKVLRVDNNISSFYMFSYIVGYGLFMYLFGGFIESIIAHNNSCAKNDNKSGIVWWRYANIRREKNRLTRR